MTRTVQEIPCQAVALQHALDPVHGQAVVDRIAVIVAPEALAAHAPSPMRWPVTGELRLGGAELLCR